MKSQSEAVHTATINVLAEAGVPFEENKDQIKSVMDDKLRDQVISILVEGFKAGEISLKDTKSNQEKLADPAKLKSYVKGLIINWYRKDKRFNGNITYVLANPGSRAGQGDSQMKNLRLLKKQFEAAGKDTTEIDSTITKRADELKASKVKNIAVDYDQIPEELKESLGLNETETE